MRSRSFWRFTCRRRSWVTCTTLLSDPAAHANRRNTTRSAGLDPRRRSLATLAGDPLLGMQRGTVVFIPVLNVRHPRPGWYRMRHHDRVTDRCCPDSPRFWRSGSACCRIAPTGCIPLLVAPAWAPRAHREAPSVKSPTALERHPGAWCTCSSAAAGDRCCTLHTDSAVERQRCFTLTGTCCSATAICPPTAGHRASLA